MYQSYAWKILRRPTALVKMTSDCKLSLELSLLLHQRPGYVHGGVRPGYLERGVAGVDQAVVRARRDEGGIVLPHMVFFAVDHQDALALDDDDGFLGVVIVGRVRRPILESSYATRYLGRSHLFGDATGNGDARGPL